MSYIGQIRTTRYFIMHEEQRHGLMSFKPLILHRTWYKLDIYVFITPTTADGLLVQPKVLPNQ
jgi:hypothetical protein